MAEPRHIPPEQALARRLQAIEGRLRQTARPTGSQNNRNKDKVEEALAKLAEQVTTLQALTAELSSVQATQQATIDYLESLTVSTAAGSPSQTAASAGTWGSDRPSVAFSTSTGKVRITVSTSMLSLSAAVVAAATFSIDGQITRDSNITGITDGTLAGQVNAYAINDGFGSGSYVHTVDGLPVNTPLTARFEFYAHNGDAYYSLPKIIVEVIP